MEREESCKDYNLIISKGLTRFLFLLPAPGIAASADYGSLTSASFEWLRMDVDGVGLGWQRTRNGKPNQLRGSGGSGMHLQTLIVPRIFGGAERVDANAPP